MRPIARTCVCMACTVRQNAWDPAAVAWLPSAGGMSQAIGLKGQAHHFCDAEHDAHLPQRAQRAPVSLGCTAEADRASTMVQSRTLTVSRGLDLFSTSSRLLHTQQRDGHP